MCIDIIFQQEIQAAFQSGHKQNFMSVINEEMT